MFESNVLSFAAAQAAVAAAAAGVAPVADAPAATRVRRTKEELIAFYQQKIDDLISGKVTVTRTPKDKKEDFVPVVGEVYSFYFGRGDNRAILTGRVLGIREPAEGEKGGRIAKIMVGEGYDADIKGVFLSAFVKADANVAPEGVEQHEEDPSE